LKVNSLQLWIGREWSSGLFSSCLASIRPAAFFYLKNVTTQSRSQNSTSSSPNQNLSDSNNEESQTSINNNQNSTTSSIISSRNGSFNRITSLVLNLTDPNSAQTPALTSPNNNRDSNFFNFGRAPTIDRTILEEEMFESIINDEIREFRDIILARNYENILNLNTSYKGIEQFFIKYGDKLPNLKKLALILLSINSSSACIERYFSICGFTSKKNACNIRDSIYQAKCLFRANFDIIKKLNRISY
jgi:hypothetical protein